MSAPQPTGSHVASGRLAPRAAWLIIAFAFAVALVVVFLGGVLSGIVLLQDGLLAGGIVAAAAGWGAWPARWLRAAARPILAEVCVSIALGLGVLALATLLLGIVGILSATVAWGLIISGWALGLSRLAVDKQTDATATACNVDACQGDANAVNPAPWPAYLLLAVLIIPLGIMLFGTTLPPGVLWSGENRAYDVLEYHLQAPREYYDAERITFLPHNVYASFPQQMEMLYLLAMYLAGGPLVGAIPAQIVHALCAIIAACALVAWLPAGWPRIVAAIVGATVPWLAYLGCLAYVEAGMLLFAAVGAGLIIEIARQPAHQPIWRIALAAGLCAGLAGGCKYTALVFVTVGLALTAAIIWRCAWRQRARLLVVLTIGAVIAGGPWLLRNAAFTGNPVYPFAYDIFGGQAWSADQAAQWDRGHALPADAAGLTARLSNIGGSLLASRMFGPALFVMAALGALRHRRRETVALVAWSLGIVIVWATLTHMPGRFVIPIIVPLTLLAGFAMQATGRIWRAAVVILALLGAGLNNVTLAALLFEDSGWWRRFDCPLRSLVGQVDVLPASRPVNQVVPPDGFVWQVGDARAFYVQPVVHYTVVFNRDPWLEYAAHATPADAVDWLRTQNVSHVVFSWDEIRRLRATYGFPQWVTPTWVAGLQAAGLQPLSSPAGAAQDQTASEIYAVLPTGDDRSSPDERPHAEETE